MDQTLYGIEKGDYQGDPYQFAIELLRLDPAHSRSGFAPLEPSGRLRIWLFCRIGEPTTDSHLRLSSQILDFIVGIYPRPLSVHLDGI